MRLTGWGVIACVAMLSVACDANGRRDGDNDATATISEHDTADLDSSAVGTSGQAAAGATSADAEGFARKAMEANKAEIMLGQLAQQKAQRPEVKEFAQMMVKDHTKALGELKQAVQNKVAEPAQLDEKHKDLHDRLSKLSGAEFDREYMQAMVDGHRDVKDMVDDRADRTTSATGTSGRTATTSQLDTAVNQWATKTLPAVEQHLQKAEQISGRLK